MLSQACRTQCWRSQPSNICISPLTQRAQRKPLISERQARVVQLTGVLGPEPGLAGVPSKEVRAKSHRAGSWQRSGTVTPVPLAQRCSVSFCTLMLVSSAFFFSFPGLQSPISVSWGTSFHTISFCPCSPHQPIYHGASFILGAVSRVHVSWACEGDAWSTQG